MPKRNVKPKAKEESGKLIHPNRALAEKVILLVVVVVVILVIVNFFIANLDSSEETPQIVQKSEGLVVDTTYTIERWEHSGLRDALKFEYRSLETAEEAISVLGEVEPFVSVRDDKLENIALLRKFFEVHELINEPTNIWDGKLSVPSELSGLCYTGKIAEQQLVGVYDNMLRTAENPQLVKVLEHNRFLANDKHLPAYEACE